MDAKFTPGEWSVICNKVDGNGYHIASINSHATTEGAANARLIAAAPELLEALESPVLYELMGMIEDGASADAMWPLALAWMVERDAAIRKANGE